MKSLAKIGCSALLFMSSTAMAVNPVPGWYGGLLLGGSYTPNVSRTFTYPATFEGQTMVFEGTGDLSYSILGNIGVSVGRRSLGECDNCRLEAQFLYNNNPYKKIVFTGDSRRLELTTGSGSIVSRSGNQYSWDFKGSTGTTAILANAFYDFIPNAPDAVLAPYVGLGLGYAYVTNSMSFSCVNNVGNDCVIPSGKRFREPYGDFSSPAGQGIIGLNYFLDDFTTFGLDMRYFTTSSKAPMLDTRTQFLTINFLFTGTFDAA